MCSGRCVCVGEGVCVCRGRCVCVGEGVCDGEDV